MIDVAIVGGGPAGSYCAYCLAENDIYPVIFDHSYPREKPCGGLITPQAQRLLPFLKTLPIEHVKRDRMYVVSPSGKQICLSTKKAEILCLSRLKLDHFLVNMAVDKGAELIEEKVIALKRKGDLWEAKTTKQSYLISKLIGADGVNSLVRRSVIAPLSNNDVGICCGYFVEGLENEEITIRFLSHRRGYIWVIPRKENTSLGIGCTEISYSLGLKKELDRFVKQHYPHAKKVDQWATLIPNIKDTKTFCIPVAGSNWMLIGDAAGHVNPLTGEGIMYALLDGELAAQAIVENNPSAFDGLWRETYGSSFSVDIKSRKWIYKKPILEIFCKYLNLRNIFHH